MVAMTSHLSLTISLMLVIITVVIDHGMSCSEAEVQLSDDGQLYVISSPYFPENYPADLDCVYHMVAPGDRRIRIFFSSFTIENPNNLGVCSFDYLSMYDGDSVLAPSFGTFCGRENPPITISTGNNLYIVFHTDSSFQKTGFRAEISDVANDYVEPTPTPSQVACYSTYTDGHGVFHSPGFPDYYESNVECAYVITSTKADNTIMLRFPSFDMEQSYNCVYDYVEVRDGRDDTSTLLHRYCGSALPDRAVISSTGPAMFVRFRSDSSGVYKGFYAEYADSDTGFQDNEAESQDANQFSVCDLSHAALTERGGSIVSHELYPQGSYDSSQYCTITIISSRTHERVFFDLVQNDLPTTADCGASGDYVQLLDGDASVQNSQVLGTFCGNDVGRFSTENSFAVVRFISDSVPNPELVGFRLVYAIYYIDDVGCDDGDWHCDNSRCIDKSLVCDGYDHCRDNSDEQRGCESLSTKGWIIAVGVSAALILIVAVCGWLFYKWSTRKPSPVDPSPNYHTTQRGGSAGTRGSRPSSRSSISPFSSTKNKVGDSPRPTEDQPPPRYANIYDSVVPNSNAPSAPPLNGTNGNPSASPIHDVDGNPLPPPPSYLEIGRRGSRNRVRPQPAEVRLKPLSRLPSSEPTPKEEATSTDMDALPTPRRGILPPIKNDGT